MMHACIFDGHRTFYLICFEKNPKFLNEGLSKNMEMWHFLHMLYGIKIRL